MRSPRPSVPPSHSCAHSRSQSPSNSAWRVQRPADGARTRQSHLNHLVITYVSLYSTIVFAYYFTPLSSFVPMVWVARHHNLLSTVRRRLHGPKESVLEVELSRFWSVRLGNGWRESTLLWTFNQAWFCIQFLTILCLNDYGMMCLWQNYAMQHPSMSIWSCSQGRWLSSADVPVGVRICNQGAPQKWMLRHFCQSASKYEFCSLYTQSIPQIRHCFF